MQHFGFGVISTFVGCSSDLWSGADRWLFIGGPSWCYKGTSRYAVCTEEIRNWGRKWRMQHDKSYYCHLVIGFFLLSSVYSAAVNRFKFHSRALWNLYMNLMGPSNLNCKCDMCSKHVWYKAVWTSELLVFNQLWSIVNYYFKNGVISLEIESFKTYVATLWFTYVTSSRVVI